MISPHLVEEGCKCIKAKVPLLLASASGDIFFLGRVCQLLLRRDYPMGSLQVLTGLCVIHTSCLVDEKEKSKK
jgi:hypothetical protein